MTTASPAPPDLPRVLRSFGLERGSPVPLWFQVARHFQDAITSDALPPGTLFENEIVMAEQLGVSRPTMRRAMEELVDRGLIVRRRGIGTRVVQPKVRRPLELTSLHDDLSAAGQQPSTEVLECVRVPADPDVAEHLRIDEGAEMVRLVRLRSAAGEPIAMMTNFLPGDLLDGSADELADRLAEHGLYDLLRRGGVRLHAATQTVGARTATAAEAKRLGEPRGAALLTMQRETLDETGRVVEYARHLYAASRYGFETHLMVP